MNFEPEKMRQPYRFVAWLCGVSAPFGGTSPDRRLAFWPKKREVRPVFEKILSRQPERIILSHGRCFAQETGVASPRSELTGEKFRRRSRAHGGLRQTSKIPTQAARLRLDWLPIKKTGLPL